MRLRWPRSAALALGCAAALLAACEDGRAPAFATQTFDAGEAEVRRVQDPHSCAVARVSTGATHTCAALIDGRVYCWGANDEAQLGLGDLAPRLTPVFVTTPGRVIEISAGKGGTCARLSDGRVACWGRQAGAPAGTPALAQPTPVPLPGNATSVATGGDHACAVLANGQVMCWGRGGLVGDGTTVDRPQPVAIAGLPATVITVFAAPDHTCVRTSLGTASCWGANAMGALGFAPMGDEFVLAPLRADAFTEPTATLSLAQGRTCALLAGDPFGRVACVPPLTEPIRAAWGDDLRALAVGETHVCAIRADGLLRCSGGNDQGQAGPDPRVAIPEETPLEVMSDAISVRAGAAHTCALRADRSLWCWGRNSEGQLGNGTTANTNTPTPVAFPPGCPPP